MKHLYVVLLALAVGITAAISSSSSAPSSNQPAVTAGDAHSYFEMLSKRPERIYAYTLRDQRQLDEHVNGRPPSLFVTYQPTGDVYPRRQDAAKVVIPEGRPSLPRQVRLPIAANDGRVLITWDAWWGLEFQTERGQMANHKTFQIGGTAFPSKRYLEVRNRFGKSRPPKIAQVDVRSYAPMGPNSTGRKVPIGPQAGSFEIQAETWTRYWALIEMDPAEKWDRVSVWVGDETRDPVQLLNRLQIESSGGLSQFWIEYNSSGQRPNGKPMIAYVRNLVVLKDVAALQKLLERPGIRR